MSAADGRNNLSFRALFAPNRDHDYFAAAQRVPLVTGAASSFHPSVAWWLAEMSLLAYVPEREFVAAQLRRAGFGPPTFCAAASTCAFITANERTLVVVFRGTEIGDPDDLKTDLGVLLRPHAGSGRVHSGFAGAIDLVWPELFARLAAAGSREVLFTGHSLGAALATIAAARFSAARALYTFGSPRVGDARFVASVTVPAFRVVNNNDLIARLPPPIVYHHVGRLAYLDRDGVLIDQPDLWQRVRDGIFGQGRRAIEVAERWLAGELDQIALDALVDHSPLHYALGLRAQAAR